MANESNAALAALVSIGLACSAQAQPSPYRISCGGERVYDQLGNEAGTVRSDSGGVFVLDTGSGAVELPRANVVRDPNTQQLTVNVPASDLKSLANPAAQDSPD